MRLASSFDGITIFSKNLEFNAMMCHSRISLDTLRAMQNQQQFDEKLQQNEELANLRADTSLEKQEMSIASKKFDFGRNFKKN